MSQISFEVAGRPQQRGSKRYMPRKGGGAPLMVDDNKKSGPWMAAVAHEAAAAMNGAPLYARPLHVWMDFRFKRPESHYLKRKSGRVLKSEAPLYHASTPDCDKLVRACGDAMSGVVYLDDKQIARLSVTKKYTESSEGVRIMVMELCDPVSEISVTAQGADA